MANLDQKKPDSAQKINWLSLDVDGVLTDGSLYYGAKGEQLKVFNVRDGYAIKLWHQLGYKSLIVSGRNSDITQRRADELNIQYVYLGVTDKLAIVQNFCQQAKTSLDQIAHIGDDLPDLALINAVGLSISVADAHPSLKTHSDWITDAGGGQGVISEVVEKILTIKGQWQEVIRQLATGDSA